MAKKYFDKYGRIFTIPEVVAATWASLTGKPNSTPADIDSAVSLKHAAHSDDQDLSGKVDKVSGKSLVTDTEISKIHTQGTDQGLDTGGPNAVTAAQAKTAYSHSQAVHAPSDAVSLATVKGDSDISDAISKKHASGSDNQAASGVPFTPDGDIVATDVQAAIEEVRDDTDIKLGNKAGLPQQIVTVGKANAQFTTIQGAIDSILDATTSKRYTVLVNPGLYSEAVVMKAFVDVVGLDRFSCQISITSANCVTSANDCEIANFHIYQTAAFNALRLVNTTNTFTVRNCYITATRTGTGVVTISTTSGFKDINIYNSLIEAIVLSATSDSANVLNNIGNCNIYDSQIISTGGDAGSTAIFLRTGTGNIKNCKISVSDANVNSRAIYCDGTGTKTIADCILTSAGTYSIYNAGVLKTQNVYETSGKLVNNDGGTQTNLDNHNALAGLQGGTGGEFYHLTAVQISDIGTISGKESLSNKSTDSSLGSSNSLYPSQKAVKDYVDGVSVGSATLETILLDIVLNSFRLIRLNALAFIKLSAGFIDGFMDETGVDLTRSINQEYNSSEDYYSSVLAQDSYTKLLLHFDGVDGSTTFTDAMGHTVTPQGDVQIDTAQSVFGGASGLFDGTGDYLDIDDSSDWDLLAGKWTLDVWVTMNVANAYQMLYHQGPGTDTNEFVVLINSSNQIETIAYSGSSILFDKVWAWGNDTGVAHHLELCRSDNDLLLFRDGTLVSSQSIGAVTFPAIAHTIRIGASGNAAAIPFNGWLDELRLSVGIARHTTNFTPETSAYTGSPASVFSSKYKLVLHFNDSDGESIIDSSVSPHTMTSSNVAYDTVNKVFGSSGLIFNAALSNVQTDDHADFDIGTEDFGIALHGRLTTLPGTSGYAPIVGQSNGAVHDTISYFSYIYNDAGDLKLGFEFTEDGTTKIEVLSDALTININEWHNYQIIRNGQYIKFYMDFVLVGTRDIGVGKNFYNSAGKLTIGIDPTWWWLGGGDTAWVGQIDEFIFYRGTLSTTIPSQYTPGVNTILCSKTLALSAAPLSARVVVFESDIDSITLNTDLVLEASIDNGVFLLPVTLTDAGEYETGSRILTGTVDFSDAPAGTSLVLMAIIQNNKRLKLNGLGITNLQYA